MRVGSGKECWCPAFHVIGRGGDVKGMKKLWIYTRQKRVCLRGETQLADRNGACMKGIRGGWEQEKGRAE